jgi:hypothetical protein
MVAPRFLLVGENRSQWINRRTPMHARNLAYQAVTQVPMQKRTRTERQEAISTGRCNSELSDDDAQISSAPPPSPSLHT